MRIIIFGRGFSAWTSKYRIWDLTPETANGETILCLGRLRLTTWRVGHTTPF